PVLDDHLIGGAGGGADGQQHESGQTETYAGASVEHGEPYDTVWPWPNRSNQCRWRSGSGRRAKCARAARVYKARSRAAAPCEGGRVDAKGRAAKPAKGLRPGDVIRVS